MNGKKIMDLIFDVLVITPLTPLTMVFKYAFKEWLTLCIIGDRRKQGVWRAGGIIMEREERITHRIPIDVNFFTQ
jgi:hypothetical protein